jgi:hypothetical protein
MASQIILSPLTFLRQFTRLDTRVRHQSGHPITSFQNGLPAEQEDYKGDVREEARRLLAIRNWKRADVGKGRILQALISAIEINDNNLVRWPNRYGHKKRPHRTLLDAQSNRAACRNFEQWSLDFYQSRISDREAFESFHQLAGGRYDLIAYLFFLKDSTRFMPIATTTFDKAFSLLGIELITARHCSWDNYVRYNKALLAVQHSLWEVTDIADARLIDAHSFCWMLIRLKLPTISPELVIPLPKAVTNVKPFVSTPMLSADEGEYAVMDEEEFIRRDMQRRRLGRLAQYIALQSEQRRLREAGHPNPEKAAKPVWKEPKRGYDILSCETDGTPRHIEVKAIRAAGRKLSFFLTQNEWKKSRALANYLFYLVLGTESSRPDVRIVKSGDVSSACLTPTIYLASIRVDSR